MHDFTVHVKDNIRQSNSQQQIFETKQIVTKSKLILGILDDLHDLCLYFVRFDILQKADRYLDKLKANPVNYFEMCENNEQTYLFPASCIALFTILLTRRYCPYSPSQRAAFNISSALR